MDFKKMLEYNSPKNVHKRLMELNNIQKVIMLFLAPCFIVIPFVLGLSIIELFVTLVLDEHFLDDSVTEFFFLYLLPPTLYLSFALYLFQSKK